MGWTVVPEGLQNMLLWISNRYGNPLVYVTENGSADSDQSDETTLNDEKRLNFFKGHIDACAAAISRGVNLSGYFAWSLMDNFEWQFGFQRRFGICRVDYETLQRTPRTSALWYRDTIRSHGINKTDKWANIRRLPASDGYPSSRALPEKVIIGYGSDCDAVREAIRDGVNIVMWSFLDVTLDGSVTGSDFYGRSGDDVKTYSKRKSHINVPRVVVVSNLNLTAIRCFIEELSDTGFDYVLHFASIGGWNAAHLNEDIPAQAWYQAFNDSVGDVFDGIDWDLEGNDEIHSKQNFFTMACLDKIGDISRLAKACTYCELRCFC